MAALVAAKAPDAEGAAARPADRAGLRGARGRRPGAGRTEGRGLARRAACGLSGRRRRREPTRRARAILAAIHRIDPAAARPLLEAALADRDWAMRVRAADLLKEGGTTTGIAERMRPATAGEPVDDPAWRAMVAPAVLAARVHRDREGHHRDRAGRARRAAHGPQLRDAGAEGRLQRRGDPPRRATTSWCRAAIRAATAKAAPATPSATRSTSGPICAARWAWRSTGATPAAASSSSRTRRRRTSTGATPCSDRW